MGPFVGCPDRKSTKYCVRTKGKDRCPFKGCSGKYRRRAPVSCLTLHRLQIYVWLAATKSVPGTRCSPCKHLPLHSNVSWNRDRQARLILCEASVLPSVPNVTSSFLVLQ